MLLRDHPGWRGAPSSLESTEPSLSFDQLTHEIGPVSTLLEERADDCSDPWSLPITGGRNLVGFKRKTFFLLFYFFLFLSFPESLPRQTCSNQCHWEARDGAQFSRTLCTQVDSCSKSISNTQSSVDSCKSLGKQKHGSNTPSMCCHVALQIYVPQASHNHQLMNRTPLRFFMQDLPSGPSIETQPLRAFSTFRMFWCSPLRKGKSSPTRGPFPWQHSVSANRLQQEFPWEGLPSGARQTMEVSFEVLPPFPLSSP